MAENDMRLTTSTCSTTNHDHSLLSGKKILEGDNNGLTLNNTLESLRGRLLAERQASKAARDEAESLANKFLELEKELREEIKLRGRAQRRLQFLKKKLESFNISLPQEQSEHSCSSDKRQNSRGSSLCSSSSTHSEEANETKPHTTNPTLSEASVLMQNNDPNQIHQNSRLSHSSHASPENTCHNPNPSYEDLNNDENRISSLTTKSSVIENDDDDDGDFVDNSLALVPVTLSATSHATNYHKPVHESVVEALDALRRAREGLLCSMRPRPMIKIGPTQARALR